METSFILSHQISDNLMRLRIKSDSSFNIVFELDVDDAVFNWNDFTVKFVSFTHGDPLIIAIMQHPRTGIPKDYVEGPLNPSFSLIGLEWLKVMNKARSLTGNKIVHNLFGIMGGRAANWSLTNISQNTKRRSGQAVRGIDEKPCQFPDAVYAPLPISSSSIYVSATNFHSASVTSK